MVSKQPFTILICIALYTMLHMAAPTARAEPDERPLTPDYSRLYYLGYDRATSSSPCIGNPVTPECAVMTRDACKNWWSQPICDTIDIKLPGPRGGADKRVRSLYKFLSKRALEEFDIPQTYKDIWQPGDTLLFASVQVCSRYVHCYTNLEDRSDPKGQCPPIDCSPGGEIMANGKHPPEIYILREKGPGKWVVVTYIMSWDFKYTKDHSLDKLLQEGLSQTPW